MSLYELIKKEIPMLSTAMPIWYVQAISRLRQGYVRDMLNLYHGSVYISYIKAIIKKVLSRV